MLLRMLKLLLVCMLPSCFRFAVLVVTDLRRAIGEHMRKRACVHVLWVACVREFAGDSAATGVRHFAGIKDFFDGAVVKLIVSCDGIFVVCAQRDAYCALLSCARAACEYMKE